LVQAEKISPLTPTLSPRKRGEREIWPAGELATIFGTPKNWWYRVSSLGGRRLKPAATFFIYLLTGNAKILPCCPYPPYIKKGVKKRGWNVIVIRQRSTGGVV
jgi:hypothetical protein